MDTFLKNSKYGAYYDEKDQKGYYLVGANESYQSYVNCYAEKTTTTHYNLITDIKVTNDQEKMILYNIVKICPKCSKANAFTLSLCNSCGFSIKNISKSYISNAFIGFIFGVKKTTKYPLTISIRYQDEEFLCFDDLLQVTRCHFNIISTKYYIVDWRYLLKKPKIALDLIHQMKSHALQIIYQDFWLNKEWRLKHIKPLHKEEEVEQDVYSIEKFVLLGFNYPPSQYQLHLQCILPPFLPFQYYLYLKGIHMTKYRFFIIDYVIDILHCLIKDNEIYDINEQKDISDIQPLINYFKQVKHIDYEVYYNQCYKKANDIHQLLSNYNKQDEFKHFIYEDDQNKQIKLYDNVTNQFIKNIDTIDKSKVIKMINIYYKIMVDHMIMIKLLVLIINMLKN